MILMTKLHQHIIPLIVATLGFIYQPIAAQTKAEETGNQISDVGTIYIGAVSGSGATAGRDTPPTLDSLGNIINSDSPSDNLITLEQITLNHLSPFTGTRTGELLAKSGLDIQNIGLVKAPNERVLLQNAKNFVTNLTNTVEILKGSAARDGAPDTTGMSGWAMIGLLSDFKCRALHEIALLEGKAFIPSSSSSNKSAYCEIPRTGKITEWFFDKSTGTTAGQGTMVVSDMTIDRYKLSVKPGSSTSPEVVYHLIKQFSYDWSISIGRPGFDESERRKRSDYMAAILSNPDIDPFLPANPKRTPASVTHPSLPKHAKDTSRTNTDSIWSRGLNVRVFAQGENIVVDSVIETQFDVVSANAANLSQLDLVENDSGIIIRYYDVFDNPFFRIKSKKRIKLSSNHAYLVPSEASCIDIMFDGSNKRGIPETRADFPATQEGWCLGRCSHPVIANSK